MADFAGILLKIWDKFCRNMIGKKAHFTEISCKFSWKAIRFALFS